jgi:phosphomannomutase
LFADESWLLFRQSGTEPVLRIYSEATSFEKRDALLDAGVGNGALSYARTP